MAFAITPSLGSNISASDGFVGSLPYWDVNYSVPSPPLGTMFKASDGHDYIFAQASGAVASNVAVTLTEGTWQFIAGSGFTAPTITGGMTTGQYAWIMRTAI
jgi:hypothetical protein